MSGFQRFSGLGSSSRCQAANMAEVHKYLCICLAFQFHARECRQQICGFCFHLNRFHLKDLFFHHSPRGGGPGRPGVKLYLWHRLIAWSWPNRLSLLPQHDICRMGIKAPTSQVSTCHLLHRLHSHFKALQSQLDLVARQWERCGRCPTSAMNTLTVDHQTEFTCSAECAQPSCWPCHSLSCCLSPTSVKWE